MDKIGIITYHGADNYGSLLQTYALMTTVSDKIGKKAEIINFISDEQKKMYSIFFENNSLKNIFKNLYILMRLQRKRKDIALKFNNFRKEYLHVEREESFNNIAKNLENEYRAVICGSDQIWNIHIKDFYDYYMLSFVHDAIKISYAASMGGLKPKLTVEEKVMVKNLLSDFDFISVRENVAAEVVKECTGKESSINIDPVFLLEKDEWDLIANERIIQEDYIFFYSIDYNDDSVEIARWFAEKYNMPVVILNTSWKSYMICKDGIKSSETQGIEDFLSLVKYAKFVLSGSFHGTAFSIIYNKPFYRVQRRNTEDFVVDDRVCTLFSKLQISDREINIQNYKQLGEKIYDIEYVNINRKIEIERNKSIEYLSSALAKCGEL